jgi:hypothetical protein
MTISELKKVVDKAVAQGHGDCDVLFDTCAQSFDVHLVDVSGAFFESIPTFYDDCKPYEYLGLYFEMNGVCHTEQTK